MATDWMTGKTITNRWGLARKTSVVGDGILNKRASVWPAYTYKVVKTFPTRAAARRARTDKYYIIDRETGFVVR